MTTTDTTTAAEAAREAALAYHDSVGLGCGWRGYRNECPFCDSFIAGWIEARFDLPPFTSGPRAEDPYYFAYLEGHKRARVSARTA